MATAKRSVRSAVSVSPSRRRYAVGIMIGARLKSIVERHVSLQEAEAFCESYNCLDDNRQAVIVPEAVVGTISGKQAAKGGAR